jgi:ACR3 family arsenite transporter
MVTDRSPLHSPSLLRFTGPSSHSPNHIVRVIAPLIVYFGTIFFFTLLVSQKTGFGHKLSATQSFTAVGNKFELAIVVAVATFDANSDQALVSTVGPLNEVPMLLGLLYVVKAFGKRRGWKDSEWQ